MSKYEVLQPLSHDQKDYTEGNVVEMTEEQAASLIAVGVIAAGTADAPDRANVKDTIALVKVSESVGELDKLAADNADRKSVLDAIEKRRALLVG